VLSIIHKKNKAIFILSLMLTKKKSVPAVGASKKKKGTADKAASDAGTKNKVNR